MGFFSGSRIETPPAPSRLEQAVNQITNYIATISIPELPEFNGFTARKVPEKDGSFTILVTGIEAKGVGTGMLETNQVGLDKITLAQVADMTTAYLADTNVPFSLQVRPSSVQTPSAFGEDNVINTTSYSLKVVPLSTD